MVWMIFIGCVLAFVALGLVIAAVVLFIRKRQAFNQRIPAMGTVIGLEKSIQHNTSIGDDDYQKTEMFYPVIEFVTNTGQRKQFRSGLGSNPSRYREGQNVKIIYDPANPDKVDIDSTTGRYLVVIVLAIFGVIMFCLGTVFSLVGLAALGGQ